MFTRDTTDDAFLVETARLKLRWPRLADAQAIERLAGDKAVAGMTALIPHPFPEGAAAHFIFAARLANARGDGLTLAVTPARKPHQLIGVVGAHPGENGDPYLGYWLGAPFWGQGFATEMARAMIDTVFEESEARVLTASVRVVNPGSKRVLEKCGFRPDGAGLVPFPARGGLFPVEHMRLERRLWASLRQWGRDRSTRAGVDASTGVSTNEGMSGRGVSPAGWSDPAGCA